MQMAEIIKPQGWLALIDDPTGPLDITAFKRKCASIHREFMFTRSLFATPDMDRQGAILGEVAQLVTPGLLKALARNSAGAHIGQCSGCACAAGERQHDRQTGDRLIESAVLRFRS